MKNKFEVGEVVIYQNGNRFELGVVKSIRTVERRYFQKQDTIHGEPTSEIYIAYMYFVNYHTGDTAALTDEMDLHKIKNLYAFEIRRKTPGE